MDKRKKMLPALFVLLLLAVAGCVESSHVPRGSADWSRGWQVGVSSTSDPIAMTVLSEERLLMGWVARPGAQEVVRLTVLDLNSGNIATEHNVAVPQGFPRLPVLVPRGSGGAHLLWIAGPYVERALYYQLLAENGSPIGEPELLSQQRRQVFDTQAVPLPDGGAMVFWTTRSGLSMQRLDAEGRFSNAPLLLPGVYRAGIAVDEAAMVHLVWMEPLTAFRRSVRYAVFSADSVSLPVSQPVATLVLSRDQSEEDLSAPSLGLERGGVYVFWSWTETTMVGVTRRTEYVFLQDGEVGERREVLLPPSFPPIYHPVEEADPLTRLAESFPSSLAGAAMYQPPVSIPGRRDQTWVGFSMQVQTRSRQALQPALALLDDGGVRGYSVVAWTNYSTVAVTPLLSEGGELFVSWVDAIGIVDEHPVYLATTSEQLHPVFNRLTLGDILAGAFLVFNRIVQGVVFLPLAAFWLVPPAICFFIVLWISGGDFDQRGSWIVFGLTILLHGGSKYLFTPSLLFNIPRFAFLESVVAVYYIVPIVTLSLGAVLSWLLYIRRQEEFSPLPAYLAAAGIDIFLSIALYGIGAFS